LKEQLPEEYKVRLPTEAEWEIAAAYDNFVRRSYVLYGLEHLPKADFAIVVFASS
jgi:formylglycine-generating enzyme required for sulfatase activity